MFAIAAARHSRGLGFMRGAGLRKGRRMRPPFITYGFSWGIVSSSIVSANMIQPSDTRPTPATAARISREMAPMAAGSLGAPSGRCRAVGSVSLARGRVLHNHARFRGGDASRRGQIRPAAYQPVIACVRRRVRRRTARFHVAATTIIHTSARQSSQLRHAPPARNSSGRGGRSHARRHAAARG